MVRFRLLVISCSAFAVSWAAGCGGGAEPAVSDAELIGFLHEYTDAELSCVREAEPEFVSRIGGMLATGEDPTLEEWFFEGIFDAEAACP